LMMIATWYLTFTIIIKIAIQFLMMNLFGKHSGVQLGSCHQLIPWYQEMENNLNKLH
jgi:hypothetical protein